jgi:hypothetical protein
MPIAPITGKLRKRLWLDLSCAFGLGISSAYAYWSVFCFSTLVGLWLLILRRQVWVSSEGWSVPSLAIPKRPLSFEPSSNFLPVVQRQEEYYLKLERQKQEA